MATRDTIDTLEEIYDLTIGPGKTYDGWLPPGSGTPSVATRGLVTDGYVEIESFEDSAALGSDGKPLQLWRARLTESGVKVLDKHRRGM